MQIGIGRCHRRKPRIFCLSCMWMDDTSCFCQVVAREVLRVMHHLALIKTGKEARDLCSLAVYFRDEEVKPFFEEGYKMEAEHMRRIPNTKGGIRVTSQNSQSCLQM